MASSTALTKPTAVGLQAGASTAKFTAAVKNEWEKRTKRNQNTSSPDRGVEAHIDDVFLVLALLGEALVPLEVFEDAHYSVTFTEVEASIASCGHATLVTMFDKLEDELKYLCTAALTVCAVFSPMHVFRGFGACVFGDWYWGCPDSDCLEKKTKKETSMFTRMPDPQPNRPVLLALDRAIQVLQVKPMAFLSKRPSISGFSDPQPLYKLRPKKDVKENLSLCEDWSKQLEKRGHPSPPGMKIASWGIPWAGWISHFSCQFTKDWEKVMFNQMDPGRLLHAFLCRGTLNLHDGQLLTLPPGSPAESLACWLSGCPGMTHRIITWDCFQTAEFEKKVGKKMTAKLSHFPLPNNFVIRNQNATQARSTSVRQSIPTLLSSGPPPYSQDGEQPTVAELGSPDAVELDSSERSASAPTGSPENSTTTSPSSTKIATGEALQKSLTTFRRKPAPAPTARHQSEPLPSHPTPKTEPEDSAPPARPPKIVINGPTIKGSKPKNETPSHLDLLNAVARGEITPQQLQDMLNSGDKQTEAHELSNDPAPPKFMGVNIPMGEVKKSQQPKAEGTEVPAALRPGAG